MSRRERDLVTAAWCGLEGGEAEAFVERCAVFDINTRRLDRLAAEAGLAEAERSWAQSREGMIARVDAVIADLLDQLAGEVVPWL